MNQIEQIRGLRKLAIAVVFTLIACPSLAMAADELHEISWGHPGPNEVLNFIVYVSPEDGSVELARQIDVGTPTGETLGTIRLYSAIVSMDEDDYVAIAARGRNGLVSPLSAWGQVQPSRPGQPVLVSP